MRRLADVVEGGLRVRGRGDRYLVSAHAHAVQLGFVMFLILGVALWLFPRAPKGDDRYDPSRIALAFWLLAFGTAARVGGEVLHDVPLDMLMAELRQAGATMD